PLRTWDLRLGRTFHLTEGKKLDLFMDAFNLFNRPNVDEVTPVYGSPVFCGGVIPRHYKDAATVSIFNQTAACPVGAIVIPGGSLAPTPIPDPTSPTGFVNLFVPNSPNPNFGQPRTMLNPRQLQFAVKFTF